MNKKRPLHGKKTEKSDNFLGRMSIKTIVLSVVALIQIMLLITGTTFSWVETISSLALTGGGIIDNPVKTVANIGSGSGYDKALDLDAYFKKAGNVHLSTCSSADGQNFYFPIVGDNKNYRQSTVNDRNVNYISYNLKVVNKEKNKSEDFKFGNIPSIKIGNEVVTDNRVRIAITVDGDTKIFSKNAATENVVAATDGKLLKTKVNAFGEYTNSSDEKVTSPVFSIPANSYKEVKISLWLQESTGSNNDNNGDVAVNDFTLVVSKKRVEVKYGTDSDSTMGDISIGSNNQQFYYGEEGTTVPLNATAKPGYKFMGWYEESGCQNEVHVTGGNFKIGSDSNITLYALFKKTYTVNVIAVTDNVQGGKGGTVKIDSGTASDKASKSDVTVGETVKLTATPNEGYDFVGWFDSATEGTQITGENPTNVEINSVNPTNRTIYARFEIKKYTVTASAVSEDDDDNTQGNKITYGDESKAQVEVTVKHGDSVTFTAKPADGSGYVFDGWYSDKACSSENKLSSEESYTVSSVKADKNIYAKFVLKTFNVEAYAYSYSDVTELSEQSAYGNVKSGNESGTYLKLIVKYGKDFSFTSVNNDYCDFENWYSDKNCETSVSSDKTALLSSIGKKDVTYYAKFKIKTKKISVDCQSKSDVGKSSVGINGSTNTSVTVNLGSKVELVATADSGYEFKGWYTDDECTGTVVSTGSSYVINPVVDSTPEKFYAKFENKKSKVIYFRNSGKWDSVCAYIWEKGTGSSNASWPGTEMSAVNYISNGYEKMVDNNTFSHVIFNNNNNGTQTADLELPQLDNSKNCYFLIKTSNNGNWTTSGVWSSYSPDGDIRIYLTNTRKWSSVCCYYKVNGGSDFEKKLMTNTKLTNSTNEPVYYVDIPNESASIKFGTNDSAISNEVTDFIYASAYYMDKDNTSNKPGEW